MTIQAKVSPHAIVSNVNLIKVNAGSLKQLIQETAHGIIVQVHLHKNSDQAVELLDAVGKGVRYGALKAYLEAGGMSFYKDKQKKQRVSVKTQPTAETVIKLENLCWSTFKHEDEEVSEEVKAKKSFASALKWLEKYPELAAEMGLGMIQLEKENQIAA